MPDFAKPYSTDVFGVEASLVAVKGDGGTSLIYAFAKSDVFWKLIGVES